METNKVVYLPTPATLTDEQRDYWQERAAYWGVCEEDAWQVLEHAQRQRQDALRMLGMLAERGLEG